MRRAAILAGGRGERLHPHTARLPKALVPLDGRPVLEILLRQLAAAGFARADLCVGHMGLQIEERIGDGAAFGMRLDYRREPAPLGTFGPLATLPDLEPDQPVLALNGDILTDLDFADVLEAHRAAGADATVCARPVRSGLDVGVVEVTPQGRLADYREKPHEEVLVSIGVNVVRAGALALIAPGERIDAPAFMLRLRDAGGRVDCRVVDAYWRDVGRIEDCRAAAAALAAEPDRFLGPAPAGRDV
ncbi:MAG: NDP-mannose synthase [Miltoncostaeaceae bacterium]|nr:NDP-mannose synthase [Miltoncostaeaceae bacterium]